MDIVLVIIFFSLRPWLGLSYSPHLWQISIQLCEEKQTPLNLTLSRGKVGDESRYAHKGAGGGGGEWSEIDPLISCSQQGCLAVKVSPLIPAKDGEGGCGGFPAFCDFFNKMQGHVLQAKICHIILFLDISFNQTHIKEINFIFHEQLY